MAALTPQSAGTSPTYAAAKFSNGLSSSATTAPNLAVAPGNFGITSGAWTIEAWVKTSSVTANVVVIGAQAAGRWFGLDSSGRVWYSPGGLNGTSNLADGAWHHIAASSNGSNSTLLFVDGTQQASTSTVTPPWDTNGVVPSGLGNYYGSTNNALIGLLDEVRISTTQRYTGNFTAPSAAFTSDGSTAALYHLNSDGTDASSNGYDAYPADGPLFRPGKFGKALVPYGVGYYTTQNFGSAYPLTIEYWVKQNGNQGTRVVFGNNGLSANTWVGTQGTTAHAELFGTNISGPTTITDNAWHHVAYTFDGTTVKIWVDGFLENSATASNQTAIWSAGTMGVGQYGSNAGTYNWYGAIDEFRISNTVRYTGTFTPSSAAFTSDSTTAALAHLDADGSIVGPATAYSATPALSGSGALATVDVPAVTGTVNLSGSGSTTTTGAPSTPSMVALTGSGALALTVSATTATTTHVDVNAALSADALTVAPVTTTTHVDVNAALGASAIAIFPTAQFWHAHFDGDSTDTPFTTTVGTVTIESTAGVGGSGGLVASGTTSSYVSWPATNLHDTSRKTASMFFTIDSLPTGVVSILQHGNVASVAIKPDGTIGFNSPNITNPDLWSRAALTPNVWYFLQFGVTNSGTGADVAELRVYDYLNETTILEVQRTGLDFQVTPGPCVWYFGRAGTTLNPFTITIDNLFATDMYRSIDFPGTDSATFCGTDWAITGINENNGSSYYQDFNSLSDGSPIIAADPGVGSSLPYATPAPNSPTSENEPSDYFVYNFGNRTLATTDSPFEGVTALRLGVAPDIGSGTAGVGFLTLASWPTASWGSRSGMFVAFRIDSLPTYTDSASFYYNEWVALWNLVGGGFELQPRTGKIAFVGGAGGSGATRSEAVLEVGVWYGLRLSTHNDVNGTRLRAQAEVRRHSDGGIILYGDTGFFSASGPFLQNIVQVSVDRPHGSDDPWAVSVDKISVRLQWPGAGYPGPYYEPFNPGETTTSLGVNVQVGGSVTQSTQVVVDVNVDPTTTVDTTPVVLDPTVYTPNPVATVEGYIDGVTINGASTSFSMSTEFTQYATGDTIIPPVTSGSPVAAVDLAWQLVGNMRCRIQEGNYWSLQGHEAGFDLKSQKLVTGRDESKYKLYHETFDKQGIPSGTIYRNWKVTDSYTSTGWYAFTDDGIYSTGGKGSSPTVQVGTRTNIICTARPNGGNITFSFGSNLTDCGFGPHNGVDGIGKWFTVTVSADALLLAGQWHPHGSAYATQFSKSASLTPLGIGLTGSCRVLIGIEWPTKTQMDVTAIVTNEHGSATLTQSMTATGLDLYARQWEHVGAIKGLYQHTTPRAKNSLASFATAPIESAVPMEVRLPSLGVDTTTPILGFTGSVWDYLTQVAIARQVDIRNLDGTILLSPMTDGTKQSYIWEPVISPSFALGVDNLARNVEIVENIATWKTLGTLFNGRISTESYSVSPGQTAVFTVNVTTAPTLLYTPEPVGGESTDDPNADAIRDIAAFEDEVGHPWGAYLIQGTLGDLQNHTVPASEWIAYGGSVSLRPIDQSSIEMTVEAPNLPGYTGDFSLSIHGGDRDYTLVRLVGDGLDLRTKTLRFKTGAPKRVTPTENASQITNVAATSRKIVNTLAARASTVANGPSIALSASIAMAEVRAWGLTLGTIPGSTLLYRNIQWRILTANVSNGSVAIEARPFSTYRSDYWHYNWDGFTYSDFISYWTGKKWDDFKVMPLAGPNADWSNRGAVSKYTLYPAPDPTEFTPPLEPATDLLPSRDLLPSGGVGGQNLPATWPSPDLYPGAEEDPIGY